MVAYQNSRPIIITKKKDEKHTKKNVVDLENVTLIKVTKDMGKRISVARNNLGLSQADLGKKINRNASVISEWENGTAKYDNITAKRLEEELKISLPKPSK